MTFSASLWESWTPRIWCNHCWVDLKCITPEQKEPLYCVLFFSVNLWQRFSSRGGASCVTHIVYLLFQSCHRSISSTLLTMSDCSSGQRDGWSAYVYWLQETGDRNIRFDAFTDTQLVVRTTVSGQYLHCFVTHRFPWSLIPGWTFSNWLVKQAD